MKKFLLVALCIIAVDVDGAPVRAATKAPVADSAAVPGICNPVGALDMQVALTPPHGLELVGLKLEITYPESVDLPGRADEASVKERVQVLPGGFLYSPNDTDGTTVVALVGTAPLPNGPILNVQFDRCEGHAKPRPADFHCRVDQASTRDGKLITEGVACAIAPQIKKEKGR